MSIFYNLFKQNDEMRIGETATFSEISYMPIVKDQGNYLVGVKRFKLPSQGIDYFRIYQDRYLLGSSSPNSSASFEINPTTHILDILLPRAGNLQGLDYDSEAQEYYMEINSDQAFCSVLNRTIAQSFMSRYSDSMTTHTHTFNSPIIFSANVAGTPLDITPSYTPAILRVDGQVIIGYDLHLQNITFSSTLPTDRSMGDLVIDCEVISVDSAGNQVKTYIPVMSGLFQDIKISEFNTKFPNGVKFSSYAKLPSSKFQFTGKYTFTGELEIFPEGNEDLDNVLGFVQDENMGGHGIVPTMNFNIRCLNGDGSNQPPLNITPNITTNIYTSQNEAFGRVSAPNVYSTDTGSLEATANGLPRFSVDNTSKKIALTFPSWLIAGKHGGVYCSNGLLELMNFGASRINQLSHANNTNTVKVFTSAFGAGNTQLTTANQLGGFLSAIDINKNLSSSDAIELVENQPSQFKRSFLWGIQIRSNNLSNDGEFVSAGRVSQKILTDFIIDPSSNSVRDYLIFEPENERFYPLNSSGDLRQLDVSVFYVDMNNNTHLLPIPPNTSASIKIEFRPQNMVYNYVDSKTM